MRERSRDRQLVILNMCEFNAEPELPLPKQQRINATLYPLPP